VNPVKIIECPRDAWQGLPRQIPTAFKVKYLRALIDSGFRHIDAVSFVSPKAVPQMADSELVLAQLGPANGVELIGIVVNEKGAERAIAAGGVTTLGYPCSVSETFLRRNQNQSSEENLEVLTQICERATGAGLGIAAYISMAFGNPYGDPWSEDHVVDLAIKLTQIGVNAISLADTVAAAEATLIAAVVRAVAQSTTCDLGIHLHSTRQSAAEKVLAAYDAGCRRFDSALAGLGGCPFAQDKMVGNIPTEEVIRALRERGENIDLKVGEVLRLSDDIAARFS